MAAAPAMDYGPGQRLGYIVQRSSPPVRSAVHARCKRPDPAWPVQPILSIRLPGRLIVIASARSLTATSPFRRAYREGGIARPIRPPPCTKSVSLLSVVVVAKSLKRSRRDGRLLSLPTEPAGRAADERVRLPSSKRASTTAPIYHRLRSCTNTVVHYHRPARP